MKECTYRLGLSGLLNRPMGHLSLRGHDGDNDNPAGSDGGDNANEGDKGDKSKESGADGEGDKGKEKAEPTPDQKRITQLEEEKQRFYDQREQVKEDLKAANDEIAKLKKDGTPDDALKADNEKLTGENAKLLQSNQSLMVENAFLKEQGYDWVDPEAAMRLADLSQVEFDEKTNKAVGLGSALAALAKKSPYLLKPKADDEGKGGDGKPAPKGTGKPPAGGKPGQKTQAERNAELRAKYPGLRR